GVDDGGGRVEDEAVGGERNVPGTGRADGAAGGFQVDAVAGAAARAGRALDGDGPGPRGADVGVRGRQGAGAEHRPADEHAGVGRGAGNGAGRRGPPSWAPPAPSPPVPLMLMAPDAAVTDAPVPPTSTPLLLKVPWPPEPVMVMGAAPASLPVEQTAPPSITS